MSTCRIARVHAIPHVTARAPKREAAVHSHARSSRRGPAQNWRARALLRKTTRHGRQFRFAKRDSRRGRGGSAIPTAHALFDPEHGPQRRPARARLAEAVDAYVASFTALATSEDADAARTNLREATVEAR